MPIQGLGAVLMVLLNLLTATLVATLPTLGKTIPSL
jgi:hypothetical protein